MGSVGKIRLMIVDDHLVCCAGLVSLLQAAPDIEVVGAAHGAQEAVRLAVQFRPDVILMDMTLPDDGAFEATRRILRSCPRTRIVFIDDRIADANVRKALRGGAVGYWTKYATLDDISGAVRRAGAGAITFCPAVRSQIVSTVEGLRFEPTQADGALRKLSRREVEVMRYLANGLSVKQCAQRMRLSTSTVDNYKWQLMKKLHVHKAADLTRLAIREGLVTD